MPAATKTKTAPRKKVVYNGARVQLRLLQLITEGEAEADWLKRIGLGSIVSQIESEGFVCIYAYYLQ